MIVFPARRLPLTAIESGVNREYTQTCSLHETVEVIVVVEYGHLEYTISLSNIWCDRVSFVNSVELNSASASCCKQSVDECDL